jgi:hypothetical protein
VKNKHWTGVTLTIMAFSISAESVEAGKLIYQHANLIYEIINLKRSPSRSCEGRD